MFQSPFIRGVSIVLGIAMAEWLLQALLRPPQAVSYLLTFGTLLGLLAAGFFVRRRNRDLGRWMLIAWAVLFLLPVLYIMVAGGLGKLM